MRNRIIPCCAPVALVLSAALGCGSSDTASDPEIGVHPVVVTTDNFETVVLGSSQPVLIDCWAAWCGPCKLMEPIMENLARDFEGRAVVAKLNVDEHPEIAKRLEITAIPAMFIFKNGEVIDQIVGVTDQATLAQKLENVQR